jgi:hypothetical protein
MKHLPFCSCCPGRWGARVRLPPLEGWVQRLAKEPFGFFEFASSEKLDLDLVSRMTVAARDEVDSVDVVVLPEPAIDEGDVNDLEALLDPTESLVSLQGSASVHRNRDGSQATGCNRL